MAPNNDEASVGGDRGGGGKRTELTVRVRYTECDPMGMAHHSAFPVWMEMARAEHLRRHGVPYSVLEKRGTRFVVARLSVRFRSPAYYDEVITVRVWEAAGGRKRGRIKVDHAYAFEREGRELATASSTLVCVDERGRPQPIPDGVVG